MQLMQWFSHQGQGDRQVTWADKFNTTSVKQSAWSWLSDLDLSIHDIRSLAKF